MCIRDRSGAGKTTLLMTLNGYMPPTSGQVRINGEDLYLIYDALRGSIGYVPQDDIVHPELTVFEAVKYSARFRLPPDYSEDEIDRRVEETLRDLGLEAVQNLQIGRPEKKVFGKFRLAFIMGYGGLPTYFGPSGAPASAFFSSILDRPGMAGESG